MNSTIDFTFKRVYRGAFNGLKGPSICIGISQFFNPNFSNLSFLSGYITKIFLEGACDFHRPSRQVDAPGLADIAKLTILSMRFEGVPIRLEFSIMRDHMGGTNLFLPMVQPDLVFRCFRLIVEEVLSRQNSLGAGAVSEIFIRSLVLKAYELCKPYAMPRQNPKNLILAAYELSIPVTYVSAYYLGLGRSCGYRRFNSTFSDFTSAVGVNIARNKYQTSQLLKRHGFPVAQQIPIQEGDDPFELAEKIGYPVVVKPVDKDGGSGVHAGVGNRATLLNCIKDAAAISKNLVIEKFHVGNNYRITFLNDVVLSATQKFPGGVLGDGHTSIHGLIAFQTDDERPRFSPFDDYKPPLVLDDEAVSVLAERGVGAGMVPASGEYVALRRRSNAISGGVTKKLEVERIHPDNLSMLREVVRLVGVDICGVDYISVDIGQPWYEVGGIIVEANAQPQIGYSASRNLLREIYRDSISPVLCLMVYKSGENVSFEEIRRILVAYDLEVAIYGKYRILRSSFSERIFRSDLGAIFSALEDSKINSALFLLSDEELHDWGFPMDGFRSITVHGSIALSRFFGVNDLCEFSAPYADYVINLGR
jgi:D-alanine-D-alanine ligase-like ATP-grasp enzyme